ncbi:hypothetical protein DFJ77DRAFT_507955 [Powellomyces hirtus]|nr:hypothetical protein DFJ77DRAFT_507955 [Powellomyces hirtus]
MKSTTLIALAVAGASVVQAAPVFSYEPEYTLGKSYDIWIDFGIMDPVPSEQLIFAYCPADAVKAAASSIKDAQKCTDIGPAGKTGSATRQGTKWVPGNNVEGEAYRALNATEAKWVLAVHSAEESLADGPYKYWQTGNRDFKIAELGPDDLVSIDPILSATGTMSGPATATASDFGPATTNTQARPSVSIIPGSPTPTASVTGAADATAPSAAIASSSTSGLLAIVSGFAAMFGLAAL